MNNKLSLSVLALVFIAGAASAQEGGRASGMNRGDRLTQTEWTQIITARFEAADADGDGMLSAEEMVAAAEAAEAQRRLDRIARMIEMRDTDDDGVLSLEEMQAPMRGSGRPGADGEHHGKDGRHDRRPSR